MRVGKKAALLAATAATLVLVGAGSAAAADGFGGGGFGGFVIQSNDCDALAGTTSQVGGAAPTGDINIGSTCSNINGG